MKKVWKEFTLLAEAFHSHIGKYLILALVLAMFVMAAAAPNATIGIGK